MAEKPCQRQIFRIQYSDVDRARLQTPLGEFEVLNCSEAGLCYQITGEKRPEVSRTFQGRILFNSGDTADVAGFVLRASDDQVALRFSKRISPTLIMNEQRWLRQHEERPASIAGQ